MSEGKKKMGRPKSENPRVKRLNIRVTEKEKRLIDQKAKESGLSLTDYVVKKLTE